MTWEIHSIVVYCSEGVDLFGKGLVDLLDSLVLGDGVLLGDLVSEGVLVTGDRGKVFWGELVKGSSELCLGSLVSHGCG